MRASRVRVWRDFRSVSCMRTLSQNATQSNAVSPQSLRDEARLLTLAGLLLIAIGFPVTLAMVLMALAPDGMSPVLPAAVGGPPLLLGYIACHYASARLARAKAIDSAR